MQPTNTNFLHQNKYTLSFARIPNVQYFCQVVSLPGVTIGEALEPTPFIDTYYPGDKVTFDYLTVTFYVDEDMKAYLEIFDWIIGMGFPENFEQYKKLGKLVPATAAVSKTPQFSDAALTILDSKQNPRFRYKFKDCFPTSLSPLVFNTSDSPENPMTADVSFRFTVYSLDKSN